MPRHPLEAPDPWIAVVCETERRWESLCSLLEGEGQPVPTELAVAGAIG